MSIKCTTAAPVKCHTFNHHNFPQNPNNNRENKREKVTICWNMAHIQKMETVIQPHMDRVDRELPGIIKKTKTISSYSHAYRGGRLYTVTVVTAVAQEEEQLPTNWKVGGLTLASRKHRSILGQDTEPLYECVSERVNVACSVN